MLIKLTNKSGKTFLINPESIQIVNPEDGIEIRSKIEMRGTARPYSVLCQESIEEIHRMCNPPEPDFNSKPPEVEAPDLSKG